MVERDLKGQPWEPFNEVVFLHNHPGWSWRDLQETPDDVIELMRELDRSAK